MIEMNQVDINRMIEMGISYLENNQDEEAIRIFRDVIQIDSGFKNLDEITELIKDLARRKQPTTLSLYTQKALIGLGIAYARRGDKTMAEDCILNGAYGSKDGGILFLAGTFYLTILDAEVDTAYAYFKTALEIDSRWIYKCDEMVQWFMRSRKIFYPRSFIEPYEKLWDEIKKETTAQLVDEVPIKDAFVERLLSIFIEFGEKEIDSF